MAEIPEAEAGEITDKYMSPFLVLKAIVALTRLDNIPGLNDEINVLLDSLYYALALDLNNHTGNQSNPHNVTKSQVGLGNLPNAKSDSTSLDDTNTLATSKALWVLNQAKAALNHEHNSLKYSGVVRLQVENGTVDFYRNLRIMPETWGDLTVIAFKPFAGNAQGAFVGREVTGSGGGALFIRVDKADGVANYDGYFEFKENGDMTFSSLDCRIRDRTTGTIIGSTSDKRLKRAITTIEESVIDKVLQLRPVLFLFKNNKEDNDKDAADRIGFISQEVEEIFPALVDTSEQGFKSIDYPKMAVILTKAIQEQQVQINSLESRLDALESRLNEI